MAEYIREVEKIIDANPRAARFIKCSNSMDIPGLFA